MATAAVYINTALAAGRNDPRLRENIGRMEKLKEQRQAYEEALKKYREEQSKGNDVGTLARQARTGDAGSKIKAIRALGDIGRDAVTALIPPLDDANPLVREAAAEELGGIGPAAKQAIPYLMEMLQAECQKTIMTKQEMEDSVKCIDAQRKAREAVGKIKR
jgi:HEAT repeat protein